MFHNYIFEGGINAALPTLMRDVLGAPEVGSRVGRTTELTHVGVTLKHPQDRYIRLGSRKANLAAQIAETMWVLAGRDDLDWLVNYLPRAVDYSDDGETWRGAYGPRLRNWSHLGKDQLAHVVDLLTNDGTTRRAVMSIYDPAVDSQPGLDIPCNNWLHFTSRLGYVDLHVAIRSNDLMWGWSGINMFEWSTLLEVVARLSGLNVGHLHFSITSLHLYDKHWRRASQIASEQVGSLLTNVDFQIQEKTVVYFDQLVNHWFSLEQNIREGKDVDDEVRLFPEPMLQSWLRVLQWWWSGYTGYLADVPPAIQRAAEVGVQPPPVREKLGVPVQTRPSFVSYVTGLHNEKHAAYGDSWKRRGEMLGIMANIARKVDRLGVNGAGDTATDTAIDLLVYLAKYHVWLTDLSASNSTEAPNALISRLRMPMIEGVDLEKSITEDFSRLEAAVMDNGDRTPLVWQLLLQAYALARQLWEADQK